jgi:hypothetical protein
MQATCAIDLAIAKLEAILASVGSPQLASTAGSSSTREQQQQHQQVAAAAAAGESPCHSTWISKRFTS